MTTDFLTDAVLAAAFGGPAKVPSATPRPVAGCTDLECCCYLPGNDPKTATATIPNLPLTRSTS